MFPRDCDKARRLCYSIPAASLFSLMFLSEAQAEDWMVRRETSSGVCHVQSKTASPLGPDLSGPFESRKAACQDAANLYEAASGDPQKCSSYGGGTVTGCLIDGIGLPPSR
jgi:hypothetical protein